MQVRMKLHTRSGPCAASWRVKLVPLCSVPVNPKPLVLRGMSPCAAFSEDPGQVALGQVSPIETFPCQRYVTVFRNLTEAASRPHTPLDTKNILWFFKVRPRRCAPREKPKPASTLKRKHEDFLSAFSHKGSSGPPLRPPFDVCGSSEAETFPSSNGGRFPARGPPVQG